MAKKEYLIAAAVDDTPMQKECVQNIMSISPDLATA